MARPAGYVPRSPTQSVLYQVVRDHVETLRAQANRAGGGNGLPRFVLEEFEGFLQCGLLANGFARFRCDGCGLDRLVPFSCKGRAVCPSCGGRRMAERAAHLVDHVFPEVPVRQWVLTLPHRIRYLVAWDHALCRAVVGTFVRAVLGHLRQRARRNHGVLEGRGGAVAILQRFGSALNLNPHAHVLVLDGVFAEDGCGGMRFQAVAPPTEAEMERLLATVARRIRRLLARRGVLGEADAEGAADGWADEAPVLAGLAAASVRGRVALGARAGAAVRRLGTDPDGGARGAASTGPCHARAEGFDLHAAVVVPGRDRARLERLCRYALRPPIAQERISLTGEGRVVCQLRHRWADGTTHLIFDPVEFLERLAALTPRPRINLLLYYGVLAAHAGWRRRVCPHEPAGGEGACASSGSAAPPQANRLWAALMARSFGVDVLACPRCGGRFRLLAVIEQRSVIVRILTHLGLPATVPSRAPPQHAVSEGEWAPEVDWAS